MQEKRKRRKGRASLGRQQWAEAGKRRKEEQAEGEKCEPSGSNERGVFPSFSKPFSFSSFQIQISNVNQMQIQIEF